MLCIVWVLASEYIDRSWSFVKIHAVIIAVIWDSGQESDCMTLIWTYNQSLAVPHGVNVSALNSIHSPLSMVMDDEVLHSFIAYLAEKKQELENNPKRHIKLELKREFITSVRQAFRQCILDGERHLHLLANLLATLLLDAEFDLHSNVIGSLPDENRPFLIRERITQETLFTVLDIDLGNHLLDNFRYQKERAWLPLELSANFVEYIPRAQTKTGVNRLTSRVKAEEELWNKVADELFHLDQLVSRDKHLRKYSKYVKDIFGVKIVCDDDATCLKVHEMLRAMKLSDPEFAKAKTLDLGQNGSGSEHLLEFLETKDYLTCSQKDMKKTGWKALKSVIKWHDRMFELQVQPLGNYYLELDHMAGPSHSSFKVNRDKLRDEVAIRVPLYGFYRKLLQMLFVGGEASFEYDKASVIIV